MGDPLLLPAAEAPDVGAAEQPLDAEQCRHTADPLVDLLSGHVADRQAERDVLAHGEVGEEREVLRQV